MSLTRGGTYTPPSPVGITRVIYCKAGTTGGGLSPSDPCEIDTMRGLVQAGDAVLMSGDFNRPDSFLRVPNVAASGTAENWIAYLQWTGQPQAIIRGGQAPSTDWAPFQAWGASHILVSGLHFFNNNSVNNEAGADSDTIFIFNCAFTGRGFYLGNAAGGCVNSWVLNNTFNSIGNIDSNSGDGVNLQNGANNNYVLQNTFGNCGHAAITNGHVSDGEEDTCDDNTIAGNIITNTYAGGINLNGKSVRAVVENNKVRLSGTAGLGDPGSKEGIFVQGVNNIVRYNEVAGCATDGIKLQANVFGGFTQVCTGNEVYHNTVWGCGGGPFVLIVSDELDATAVLINNIIDNNLAWANHTNGATDGGRFFNSEYQMVWFDLFAAGTVWGVNNLGGNRFRNNGLARVASADNWAIIVRDAGGGDNLYYTLTEFQATFANCSANEEAQDPEFTNAAAYDFSIAEDSYAVDAGIRKLAVPYYGFFPDLGAVEAGEVDSFAPGLIDSFTRDNEDPLANGSWDGPVLNGTAELEIESNLAKCPAAAEGGSYWSAADFGPDCEAAVAVSTKPGSTKAVRLFARLVTPGTAGLDGYFANLQSGATPASTAALLRVDNGTPTALTAASILFPAGDAFGIKCEGDNITFMHRIEGVWCKVITVEEDTYGAAGAIGLGGDDATWRASGFYGSGVVIPVSPGRSRLVIAQPSDVSTFS